MNIYSVGFIYTRCFLQKTIAMGEAVEITPLTATGFAGSIHDGRKLLELAKFPFSRPDLRRVLDNFQSSGQSLLVRFNNVSEKNFQLAIESKLVEAENIVGAVSVISRNPAVALCAFAQSSRDSGVKFTVPNDPIIKHGTNIPGFLDALPDIYAKAEEDPKLALLLRLFRASLRESEIDNQLLFQLILFEEASDNTDGNSLAERLRTFSENIGFSGDLNIIAGECGVRLPDDKDVIDLLVKLRNAAAHNGKIDEASLHEFNAEWVLPILEQKEKLHKLIGEALRYMFCCMAGHTREAKAIKITGATEITFD